MPVNLPTGRAGQALAAGLALFALLLVWLGVVAPVLDFYATRQEEIAQSAARIARQNALIASLPALREAAQSAGAKPSTSVLSGATDAIAGAALQEQVQGMAAAASATLTSIETLPADQHGNYRRIGVRVQMSATLPVIVALMRAVEEAEPAMVIDDLHITSAGGLLPNMPAVPMDANFSIYAFRRGTAPTRGDGATHAEGGGS